MSISRVSCSAVNTGMASGAQPARSAAPGTSTRRMTVSWWSRCLRRTQWAHQLRWRST